MMAIIEKTSDRQRSHLCHHLYIFCRKTSEKLLTRSRLPTLKHTEHFQELQKDVYFLHVRTNYPKHKLTPEKKLLRL